MAIREVKPLNAEQWKFVLETINKKPTSEQRQMICNAIEEGNQIKIISE